MGESTRSPQTPPISPATPPRRRRLVPLRNSGILIHMSRNTILTVCMIAASAAVGYWAGETHSTRAAGNKVFELRTYTSPPGKLGDLENRFRNHTMRIFEKHGMKNVGYWIPQDEPKHSNTLIYIISHENREQATKNWAAFRSDPDWQKASKESEANGKIVEKAEFVFMDATDYSPIK